MQTNCKENANEKAVFTCMIPVGHPLAYTPNFPRMKTQPPHPLPEGWEMKRLGELAEFKNGLNYSQENSGKGLKIIGVGDFKENFTISYDGLEELSGFDGIHESYLLKNNDLLFVRSNGSKDLVGRALFIQNLNERVTHSGFTIRARLKAREMLPVIAAYYFQTGAIKKQLLEEGGGTNISNLSQGMLANLLIPLPPLPEQRQIAAVLGTWDTALEQTTALLAALRTRHRGLMQNLLTGKVRAKGFGGEWREVKLGEVFKERNQSGHNHLPLLSITAEQGVIHRDELVKRDTSNEDKSKYKRICPGDIGYNTMRMWQGRSAVSSLEGIVSPAYTIVTPKDNADVRFMGHLFKFPEMIHRFFRNSQGLVDDTLNCKFPEFAKVKVSIPPTLAEQRAIAAILDASRREIQQREAKLEALREQKRGLMQSLLTGRVRVTEPAPA